MTKTLDIPTTRPETVREFNDTLQLLRGNGILLQYSSETETYLYDGRYIVVANKQDHTVWHVDRDVNPTTFHKTKLTYEDKGISGKCKVCNGFHIADTLFSFCKNIPAKKVQEIVFDIREGIWVAYKG